MRALRGKPKQSCREDTGSVDPSQQNPLYKLNSLEIKTSIAKPKSLAMRTIRYHEYNDEFRPIIRQISKAYMKSTNKDGTPLENAFKRRLHIYEVITSHTHNLVGHSPKRQTSLLREMNKCVRKNTLRNSHKRVVRLWCPIIRMNIFIPVYSSSSVKSKHPSTDDADSSDENSRDSNTIGNLTKEIKPKHSGLRALSSQHGCISKTCGCKTQSAISYANNDVVTTTETAMICGTCGDTPTYEDKELSVEYHDTKTVGLTSDIAANLVSEPNTIGVKYYITDGNGVNWYTIVNDILLQKNSRFSCSLLKWYRKPGKVCQPTKFYHRILTGLARYTRGSLNLHVLAYGEVPSKPTFVAKRVLPNHVQSSHRYTPTIKLQTKSMVDNGILKFEESTESRDNSVTFQSETNDPERADRSKRRRRRKPKRRNDVPTVTSAMRRRLRHTILKMAKVHPKSGRICVDSGATVHLVKSNKWLGKLINRHKVRIRDAVGKTHESSSSRALRMTVRLEDGSYHHLPNMGRGTKLDSLFLSLLSVSQLCDQGYSVVFKPDHAELRTPDDVVVPLTRDGGLYFIEGKPETEISRKSYGAVEKEAAMVAERDQRVKDFAFIADVKNAVSRIKQMKDAVDANPDTSKLGFSDLRKSLSDDFSRESSGFKKAPAMRYWRNTKAGAHSRNAAHMWHLVHRRMGHPSRAVTDGLVRSGAFGTIPMCDERDKFCECCAKAAFYRPKAVPSTHRRTDQRGTKWHVDLAGPFEPDRNGHRYAMNMVDDCTGMFWGTTLKSKKGAARGLVQFLDWLSNQKSLAQKPILDITCLQSDRGGEFTSGPEDTGKKRSLFDKLCKKKKIARLLTSAKSPNQNGRAERANRTLFGSMRCNLMDSGLGWKHWGDAYKAAIEARNCAPRENGKLSRFERFYGYAPSYKRLMPFGATGFLEHKTDKTNITRSKVGRMIGYPKDTKGWTFLKEDGSIEVTSHARFDTRNYMDRALAKGEGDHQNQGFTLTQGTIGLPLGGSDASIREAVRKYENDIIVCSEPDPNLRSKAQQKLKHESVTSAPDKATTDLNNTHKSSNRQAKRNSRIIMTRLEAEGAIQNARDDNYTVEWDPNHIKTGKSGNRYQNYKGYKTFQDVDTAILKKIMSRGDLRFDVMRGICKLVKPEIPKIPNEPQYELEAIEINFAGLTDSGVIKPIDHKIGPIERLYDLRSSIRGTQNIQPGDWNSKLISAVHMGCAMGWEDKGTIEAINEFALSTINEIICGKVTPLTLREAKSLPEWETWKSSMTKEFKSLQDMGVFELIKRSDLPRNSKVVKTKWIYKIKQNSDGTISKYKSRLVAQGFLLRWGIDYYDTYSSVVGYNSLRIMLNIAAITGEQISQADIGNAYVESSPDEDTEIFVTQAPGLEEMDPKEYVYKMNKNLYGIPFSGRTFQRVMEEFLTGPQGLGFTRCITDKCVYTKWVKGERIVVLTYVDDLISMTHSEKLRKWWKDSLHSRFKKITYNDTCEWILNMKLTRGEHEDGRQWLELSQELAITKIAQACGLTECRRTTTPIDSGSKLHQTTEDDPPPNESWSYPSVLGGVMYIANTTRADIAYATSRLTRYLKNPSQLHCQALKRLVKYLWTTKHIGLRYTSGQSNPFKLTTASDASFADCEDTKRSTLGWCQWLGDTPNGLITWGSRIGKTVALSTTESEVQAALELTRDIIWTRDFLSEIGYLQTGSTRIYEDNNGCIGQANANKGMRKARHYLIALAKLNEACQSGQIHLFRVDSDDNTADFFTKGLGGDKHTKFGSESQGCDLSFLYKSRKMRQTSEKEGERISQANLVIIGEDDSESSSTDGLRVSMEYTGGRGIKVDNYTNLEYQTVPMSRNQYLQIALKHADAGNESKFNMYFKAAKLLGHIPSNQPS